MWAKLMRFSIVPLLCLMLLACGKTGALYLPEEPPAQPEPPEQNTQSQSQDTSTGGKAD